MKLPVLIFISFCTTILLGFEDLGPLKSAQKEYPQIFKTGIVEIITINKTPCYVFSGEAEQAFSGDFSESASELYEEATLTAKSNFYEVLSKKNKNANISMSGCGILYQYNDKKTYNVILFVPKSNVSIKIPKTTPNLIKKESSLAPISSKEKGKEPKQVKTKVNDSSSQKENTKSTNNIVKTKTSSIKRRITKFKNKIKNNPKDVIPIIGLADLYKKDKNYSEAIKFYRLAIEKMNLWGFFDSNEKIRIIYDVATLAEKTNKNNIALKYFHYLLRHKCSYEQRKKAVESISRLKLKMLD